MCRSTRVVQPGPFNPGRSTEDKINPYAVCRRLSSTPLSSPLRRSLAFPSADLCVRLLGATLLIIVCISLGSCDWQEAKEPTIKFTNLPRAEPGNPTKMVPIEGRVTGAQPGQRVVLYARASGAWWVQPLADHPFTNIQPNSRWKTSTHPGTDYAALLVGPDFQPPSRIDVLPTVGVFASIATPGNPVWWRRWWFPPLCLLIAAVAILGLHRLRIHQTTTKLGVRFEERLAERTRVAQELHDTLLQGVIAASMQLQVALDQMPPGSPAQPTVNHVLQLMGRVVEEGRNTVRGLRSEIRTPHDFEQVISSIAQELNAENQISFRVIVEGRAAPLQAAICNDVYGIAREALVNAFRHSGARAIEVDLRYAGQFRVLVRDNGSGIDQDLLRSQRGGKSGLSTMRERAERIGGKLRVSSRAGGGTEVELRVPGSLSFESNRANREKSESKWRVNFFGPHRKPTSRML
jgi:signal transduction histidine kinase